MQDHKVEIGKNILIFARISNYKKVDFEKLTTFIVNISYNKKKIKNIKICNAITKFANEKITQIAYLEKNKSEDFVNILLLIIKYLN